MYTELHARSAFSFLEGASLPEELAAMCAESGMPAMALLDRDGVYGAPRFYLAAQKASIHAHIGTEITSTQGWRYPLLVVSGLGYQNLCRLITKMKLRGPKGEGRISSLELAEYSAGLICLTGGGEGPLAHSLAHGGMDEGIACVQQLRELFGRQNVYVELQRHFCRKEEARNQAAVAIAHKFGLPLLATNGVCYALPQRREVMDVFTAIRNHRTLATAGRLLAVNSERHLKPPAEMERLFADLPEAIANTQELSSRLEFSLKDLGYRFPDYPVPAGQSQIHFLRQRTQEGMLFRYGSGNDKAQRQIEHELSIIAKLHMEGYFLIVWDIVRFCREHNILVQGRGSAANSAVCYALGITAVDPVGMELLFERFLTEERGEWPDIDLDLPSGDQRERAIQYVYQRYGQLGAAMTANVITYRGRSAAREIGKVMSFDPDILNRLTSLVGHWEYRDANDTLERKFCDAGLDVAHPQIRKFFELCIEVQDLPRHLGQHSGGLVICQGQLDSIVPLEPATMPGRVVVQWDKDDCADMGIVKVDLLGLGMMAVLEDCLHIIKRDYGEEIDLGRLPAGDDAVYSVLQKADTVGMFQIESRAQMSCLPRLQPKNFYDIVVQVAIIRPGPIVGEMVNPFLKRRQGREAVDYPHPSLEPVLKRTLGIPLFQEQLLRMAMITAGFTGGQAEELRRAFGFKRSEKRMKEVEKKLRLGMDKNGVAQNVQDKIVQAITSFALYGFPESHAASFALLAYASAYFKCHYLPAFTAAILNNQPMGFYQPATLVKDAQRHGLKVRPIDVTCSNWLCTLENTTEGFSVRLGLRYVKGLRADIAAKIVQERAIRPFVSIDDLKMRVPAIQKVELATLAAIGSLNHIGSKTNGHRREALWQIERVARNPGSLLTRIKEPSMESDLDSFAASPLPPMNVEERLVADFKGTGMTVGLHPVGYHRAEMKRRGIRSAAELSQLPNGMRVRVAGSVIARQRPGTAKGFVFLSLEDETGIANAIITPQIFENNHLTIVHHQFLLIDGQLQNQDNVVSVKAERIVPLQITKAETTSHDFH
ncbi:MAG TPA: error-prone DNA polymerase [Candidatus Acidoferrales bacterium]|nr:error-prone DNA polymerase [Candidatus Acidoferrales bacterium]